MRGSVCVWNCTRMDMVGACEEEKRPPAAFSGNTLVDAAVALLRIVDCGLSDCVPHCGGRNIRSLFACSCGTSGGLWFVIRRAFFMLPPRVASRRWVSWPTVAL